MAVSPIGNVTFINQNAQVGSVQQANAQVKLDFQAMVNLQSMQEEQDEIQEVRPTEENAEVKDEREGDGKEEREEEKKEKKETKGLQEENTETSCIEKNDDGTILHLNISV